MVGRQPAGERGAGAADKVGTDCQTPCGTCKATVSEQDDVIECSLCNLWHHIVCEKISL